MAAPRRGKKSPLWLPLLFIAGLAAFSAVPHIQDNASLLNSFVGATAILLLWLGVLFVASSRRPLSFDVQLRPQHYVQAVAHTSIFVYWSFYWPPIVEAAPLIAAQIVFAYAFDMLLCWSRRDSFTLGFGPFPIIYSTNLFLRFHDDWFALQFVMIAVGMLVKELVRWERGGRRVHIFNPSSFPLALASLLLIVSGSTDITWGEGIATQLFLPPQIFLFIFLVSLPGQLKFGVTTMTLSAVLTTYLFSLAYFRWTGTYYFIDDNIPIAVFLGMNLLFTDPSTSPQSELGRIIFGVTYGATVVWLYWFLGTLGVPTFYDKLLQVPLMNLAVRRIDAIARSPRLAWLDPARLGAEWPKMRRNFAYTSIWVVVFGTLTFTKELGDLHPGHHVPFWVKACDEGRRNGCRTLEEIELHYCGIGSGWACNDLGVLMTEGRLKDNTHADQAFARACGFGNQVACANRARAAGQAPKRSEPSAADLTLLLREGKGALPNLPEAQLHARACAQGWAQFCAPK
ncbi:MAG: hypothetical protein EPO35_06900 [Acidobacteria bacterium]|nr:MAG: hypothetical protein EPO35_06900 [Acidobacteriota bacterium]